jgi:hypothetical protein
MQKKYLLIILSICLFECIYADTTLYIKVHFNYGSKPKHKYKAIEHKYFGGLHGGHVTLQLGDSVYGFNPSKGARVFSRKNKSNGVYILESELVYHGDTNGSKQSTIIIPVSRYQFQKIKKKADLYLKQTPYDYAFFGMRCASACYDLLSEAEIVKRKSIFANTYSNFYPKLLRKKLLNMALEKNYTILHQPGRMTRKWEKDPKKLRKKLNLSK